MPRNFSRAGDVAEIKVDGVLTQKPDFFAMFFGLGNTTYEQIRSSIALAESDPTVRRIVYDINSPGGSVDGLFETLAAIDGASKPSSVRASMADSAAYAIAAVAGRIEANTAASEFGSVGVVATFFNDEELIDITSTNAPNKRPDPATEEGQAVIREYLDSIHDLFVEAIADGRTKSGRTTTKQQVNEEFGRGAVLLARDARKRGMIDRINPGGLRAVRVTQPPLSDARAEADMAEGSQTQPPPAASGDQPKRATMTEQELKEKHPELYAAVLDKGRAEGNVAGRKEGVEAERKRVNAHLKMGKNTGAQEIALKAIESGASVLDEEVHADYMSAAMNRKDSNDRQTDSDVAGAVVSGATPAAVGKDLGDQVADILDAQKGVTANG